MRRWYSYLFAIILCLPYATAGAQSPPFMQLKLGDGKKHEKVHCIAQDDAHHLYLGTSNGLFHYNGIRYEPIQLNDSVNVAVSALAFLDGVLWIGGNSGELYCLVKDSLWSVRDSSYGAAAKVSAIGRLGARTWIATYGDGVYLNNNEDWTHITTADGLADDYTYDALVCGDELWVGTDAGISIVDNKGQVAHRIGMSEGLPDNIVRSLCLVNEQCVAVGMHDYGVALIDAERRSMRDKLGDGPWTKGTVTDMVVADRLIWVATQRDGVMCFDIGHPDTACKSFTEISGLSSNRVLTLMEDAERNIWMGTYKGASVYTGSTMEFLLTERYGMGNVVLDLALDKEGAVLLSSNSGVFHFDYDNTGEGVVDQLMVSQGELGQQVVSLLVDSSGQVWMGTYGSGLIKYDPKSRKSIQFTSADGLCNNNIMDLALDGRGRLWMATLGGGVCYASAIAEDITFHTLMDQAIGSQYIYSLFVDRDEVLWIGTDGAGVVSYDCQLDQVKPDVVSSLSTQSIYSISQGGDGELWFSTAGNGIYRLHRGGLQHYSKKDGLRSLNIAGIAALPSGDLVVAHPLGFDVLNKGNTEFIAYEIDAEAMQFEPNLNAVFVASDGAMWTGGNGGVVRLDLQYEAQKSQAPEVSLTGLRVLYQPVALEAGSRFAHNENHFVFDYLGIWMRDPSSISYSYILEGFDQQWSFETKSLVATYSSLPPGKYEFKVKARSAHGDWSDPAKSSYAFEITKPFWEQWWFMLLVLVLAIATIAAFIRYRTQRLRAEKHRLEEEVKRRTKEITRQKEIIEFKNEEILSSISYAKRIQEAILPPPKLVREHLSNSFILYKPKDIVAGDFYWMETGVDEVIFAAADCTGHGVPGAMVSVVCSNALNRAVREFVLTEPAKILDKTLEIVIERFAKSEEEVKDGMDIALCALNLKTKELQYAGANNPLWVIGKPGGNLENQLGIPAMVEEELALYEVKATKQPIGKYVDPKPFENHSVQLEKGDTFYIFSDGYPDQFGGDKGKKLKAKAFKQLLLSMQHQGMDAQRILLDDFFEVWRGDHEQIDDVCVIGVRA